MDPVVSGSPILDYAKPPPRTVVAAVISSPWLLLPLILLAGFALRWFHIDSQSLWLDEFLAVQNSTGRGQHHISFPRDVVIDPAPHLTRLSDGPGLWSIWGSLRTDSHPPLHFMVLNVWRHIFGEGDAAARSLSVAFSLLAIVLLYDIARLLHGRTVALWAALLMALAGVQIQYAQEARNYTMLLALTLGACDALVRIEQLGARPRRSIALGACILAMLLTHYLAVPAILAIALYAAVRLRGLQLQSALAAMTVAGLIFVTCWGMFFLQQSKGLMGEISSAVEQREGNVFRGLRRLSILPLRYFTEPMKGSIAIGQVSVVMYLLPLLLLWKRRDLLLWCLLGGSVILWVFLSDLIRSAHGLAYSRYSIVATAPTYALAAAMLWHMKGIWKHLVPLVLSIACLAAIAQPYTIDKADTRELARLISSRCDPDDILIVHTLPDHDWRARALYLGVSHYAVPKCPVVFLGDPPSDAVRQRIRVAREVWLMSPAPTIPTHEIFPHAQIAEGFFFPSVGSVQRVRLPGNSLSAIRVLHKQLGVEFRADRHHLPGNARILGRVEHEEPPAQPDLDRR